MSFSRNTALVLLFCVFSFALYLFTAPPFMLWLDSARFVSAIVTLGVSNPPEPLYILLAHPFTYLPFGSIIFRIQIFTALTAAATLFLLYKLIMLILEEVTDKLLRSLKLLKFSAFFGVGSLAFSYQFWSQAQNIETFILVTFITVLTFYLVLRAKTNRAFFISFIVIAGLLGLATGTNPVIASIAPSLLLMMVVRKKFVSKGRFALWVVVGILAIILVHLYIPIRASQNPFLNYWKATDIVSVWKVSTGADLNVYLPELGRINGFTGSLDVFFGSTLNYIKNWFIKFTPFVSPFMVLGIYYLWKRNKTYFFFFGLVIFTNWLFSSLYFSGNQESWYLVSDISWVVFASAGFLFVLQKLNRKYINWLFLIIFLQLVLWFPFLNRRSWVLTEDYLKNLYQPVGDKPAIVFGSSDLFDATSFLVHDVKGTSVYKPNVIPITDNLFYIYKWYRDNLKVNADLQMPDDTNLEYNSTAEYSNFVADFFNLNMKKYKIYITTPAARTNFLQAYGTDQGKGLQISERFNLVPQGTLFEVLPKTTNESNSTNLSNFDYRFHNSFPKNKPFMMEGTYKGELTGILNEYAYSIEKLGDDYLNQGKADEALRYYQKALEFNHRNAEVVSRIGNYYGSIGNHQKAAEYFEKALAIEPDNLGAMFNLAFAYESAGQKDKAISNYNKVIDNGQNDLQMAQRARDKLAAINSGSASGSAALQEAAVGSGPFVLPVPDGSNLYKNEGLNIQFVYPKTYKVIETGSLVTVSNNLKDRDELTVTFFGRKMKQGETVDNLAKDLPFKVDGSEVAAQQVGIEGYEASGKTYASNGHITFLILMKRGDSGVVVKIYPGDTNQHNDFNQILQSIKPVK